jgi:hypothetical protein
LLAEMSRAVAVIVRSGRRKRPAISQPSPSDTSTMTARPAAENWISCCTWCSSGVIPGGRTDPAG